MPYITSFLRSQLCFTPPEPTTSFKGKTVIVTGGSGGLGAEVCRWIAGLGASRVIIACRNMEKGMAAAKDIEATTGCPPNTIDLWPIDMASYASVQAFATKAKTELPRLDALIANAGIHTQTFRMAEDNESTITINFISIFLLGFLLYPKLRETAEQFQTETYFTTTSSSTHEIAKFEERKAAPGQIFATLNDKSKPVTVDRYSTSKLLEIIAVRQMAARYPLEKGNVIINCVCPGMCKSELAREYDSAVLHFVANLLGRETNIGSRNIVYGASCGPQSHGQFLSDCKIMSPGGILKAKGGQETERRVWEELLQKLEAIQAGVTSLA